ncbi:MAG: copper resistance protein CopC [Rothia sp. (in: high G+C Gram-positive bacteria)]|nr:copper resistance protein CopC [Rothia sp. (in: high G+C Gram-positive bacteria)]
MFKAPTASTRTFIAALALATCNLLAMHPASAHDELVSTNPTDGATLTEAPASIELTYSGDIMDVDGANQVRVTNTAGESVTDGSPQVEGTGVTQNLAPTNDDTYTVTWRAVSSDGHPIQGTFTYTVEQGNNTASSATPVTSPGDAEPSAEHTGSTNTTTTAPDPMSQVGEGLPTSLKAMLALLAVAALGSALVIVLAKTKRQ